VLDNKVTSYDIGSVCL